MTEKQWSNIQSNEMWRGVFTAKEIETPPEVKNI